MGKTSVPKRGRGVKSRPLRSDSQPRGMPRIALGKAPKAGKLKVVAKKGKVQLKPTKSKPKSKSVTDAEDNDTALVALARARRSNAQDNDASTSRSSNESLDTKGSKRQRTSKASLERSDSPANTRLSRSSSSSSLAKSSEAKKGGKESVIKGKGASPSPVPSNKGLLKYFTKKKQKPAGKSNTAESKKELCISKKGVTSSPESVNSSSSQSNLVNSERSDINDDEQDVENDNDGSFVELLSEDLGSPKVDTDDGSAFSVAVSKSVNGDNDVDQKSIPKLTRKNINELFPSDDMAGKRLRSGSPASQKSTRSLTLHRNSPTTAAGSSVRYATRSDSAVRVLRNGKHSKLKRSGMFEGLISDTSKKKRVYAGALKDEDKIEDSRSDFSDEQSSIFSESDSSSFIDTFSRLKGIEMDDKIDGEEIQGSMSNDEDDIGMGRIGSPTQPTSDQRSGLIAVGKNVSTVDEENADTIEPQSSTTLVPNEEKDSEDKDCQMLPCLPRNNEILNNIQSDWDSDGEGNKEDFDTVIPKSPKEELSALDDIVSDSTQPEEKEPSTEGKESVDKSPNDVSLEDLSTFDDEQDVASNSSSHSHPSVPDSSVPESQTPSSPHDPSNPSDPTSKIPDPIVLKAAEKNGFAESVEFVAKKSPRIDFELLRRRTKRSMSFNMDTPDKNHSQRILSVESNKLHGKPTLIWTVKAVREPIIPKSGKSPEKGLNKSESQESRNLSPVKPMMESIQNDASPKVTSDTVPSNTSFPLSSSSVKENILVQNSSKQSAGKSPVRESMQSGGALKPVQPTLPNKLNSEVRNESPFVGSTEKDKPATILSKASPKSTDSTLATTMKQSVGPSSPVDKNSVLTPNTPTSPSTMNMSLHSSSNDNTCNDVSLATAVKTPITQSNLQKDPVAPCLTREPDANTGEAAIERCTTPQNLPILQNDSEFTPQETSFDDGESFSLRLSPSPTKEDKFVNHSAHSPVNKHTPPEDQQTLVEKTEEPCLHEANAVVSENLPNITQDSEVNELIDNKEVEANAVVNENPMDITKDLEVNELTDNKEVAPPVEGKSDENVEILPKVESQTIQLVRKKSQSSSRPRSRSADFSPTSLACNQDDIWIVKTDVVHTLPLEKKKIELNDVTLVEKQEDAEENVCGTSKNGINTFDQTDCHIVESQATCSREGDILRVPDEKNTAPSYMTVECPDIQIKQPGLLSPRLEADVQRLHLELNDIEKKRREISEEELSPEKKAFKERMLSSLGLQSVAAAAAASVPGRPSKRRSQDGIVPSSGRLKAVIKVPKDSKRDKKSDRKPLRMVFKNGKPHSGAAETPLLGRNIEADSTVRLEGNLSDTAASIPMINGLEYGVSGNIGLPESSASISTLDADGKAKPNLVIPEKSSSFSIHPGRLCSDVCSYCFGKFGSLDTPCHVAQLKSRERQMKIMSVETQLAMDSCLCDACIRYVDRKANCPSSKPQASHRKEGKSKFEGPMANCSVTGCVQPARHSLKKKWYIKIKKSVMKKCPIDLDLAHHQLPLPLCPEHFSYMEYFMVCGLCKKRLSKSHMYNLSNTREINICLEADGIPARLSDKLFVCKLCRYYATLRVKHPGSHFNLSANQREFFNSYRKKILSCHDIDVSESEEGGTDLEILDHFANQDDAVLGTSDVPSSSSSTTVTTSEESLPKGKRKRSGSNATSSGDAESGEQPKKKSRSSDSSNKSKDKEKLESAKNGSHVRSREREIVPSVIISVADHHPAAQGKNPRSSKASKSKQESSNSSAMEWVNKGFPPFYPGEDELALHGKFQFQFDDEPSANRAWEKCTSTLQFDKDTKKLWQELQRPYGSQSSFLRHLVLMERHWRQGELILAPDASPKATSYTRSVQNRLKAYGSTITVKAGPEPPKPAEPSEPAKPIQPPQTVLSAVQPRSVTPVPANKVTPDVSLALTGGTVLTAAAAAAAVTAVHLSSSPAPLPSPSSSTASGETTKSQPSVPAPQSKQQKKQQGKSQPRKSQPAAQGKQQVAPRTPPVLQVAKVAPQSVKSPPGIRMTVKVPTSLQVSSAGKQQMVQTQATISSGGLSVVSLPMAVPVTAGVTISAEPKVSPMAERSQGVQGKLILPKPSSTVTSKSPSPSYSLSSRVNSSPWEGTSLPATSRPQFVHLSSAPVVNLTRSISLTAVPSTPPSVPDLHPINSETISTTRPNRSPSASLPLNTSSMLVASSRGSSGGFVSIIPTSPSKGAHTVSLSQALNKHASITPIYTSQSLPSSVSVTSTATAVSSVSSPAVLSSETRTQPEGKVHVTAGGKSFSLTIQQFKKLQALRQQRQLEQQSKLKRLAAKPLKERKVGSTIIPSCNKKDDLEVVEVRDTENESQQVSFPTISAVCSGDQAKAMWNEESRTTEFEPTMSVSVTRPMVEISPIVGTSSNLNVENLPKIPKTLTVTQIRKESPLSKTVSASGMSLTITRQTCQTPVPPQISSPALDIFPS